jgi:heterodisulfide reductase subunit C
MLYEELAKDIRIHEGINSCISCGTCTAICPAAQVYPYQPRAIAETICSKDELRIEELLKSDTIWYCGECMSCKTRCPRGNAPGLIIMALRELSIKKGFFTESEKGRQQLVLKRTVGEWSYKQGYCVHIDHLNTEMFPELGPIFDFEKKHLPEFMERVGASYHQDKPGVLRNIPQDALDEINSIFEVTGAHSKLSSIETYSAAKAKQMNMELGSYGLDSEYIQHIFCHSNEEKHSI